MTKSKKQNFFPFFMRAKKNRFIMSAGGGVGARVIICDTNAQAKKKYNMKFCKRQFLVLFQPWTLLSLFHQSESSVPHNCVRTQHLLDCH
jgi:hypothetical protein